MMAYVEYLRARRVLLWYFGILIGLYAIGLIASFFTHGTHGHVGIVIDMGEDKKTAGAPFGPLPISILEYGMTFGAILIAAILGSALNRQRENLPLVWTRPLGRGRFALAALAVDALAIAVTFFGTLLFFTITTLRSNPNITWYADSLALPTLALGLGAALMTYALVQALTSWHLANGGLISGLVIAGCAALIGLGSSRLPSPYGALVGVLNYLNPFAYYGPVNIDQKHGPIVFEFTRYLPLDLGVKIACVWLLAAVYMAIATYGWKRLEI
jgi:hypothetical protein